MPDDTVSTLNTFRFDKEIGLFERFAQLIPDFVYIFDLSIKKIVFISRPVTTILGYTEEDIRKMGDSLLPVMMFEDGIHFEEIICERIKNSLPNEAIEFNSRFKHKNGSERVLRNRCIGLSRNENGNTLELINIAEDITDISRSERQKIEELNKSNQELEQFAYIASHDLQEPLRKITAFGERLTTKLSEQLGSDGLFYLSRMIDATNRMKALINNLLSYSRASRKMEPHKVINLNEVLKGVLGDLELKIHEKKAKINIVNLPSLEALPSQMEQLFQNLLSNSLKFSKQGVPPEITITSKKVNADEIKNYPLDSLKNYYKITLKDNGVGFLPEYEEQIFVIFQRIHGRSEYEGSGIGLAISKKIVENHKGYIFAKGKPEEGADFIIYLPDKQN